MLSKILKREWVTIMNNVFDISLNVLVDCVNEKKDFSLLIKEYTKNVKLNNYKKTCLSICGIVLRNYYLIKYFANHVLKFTDTRLVLATGIVFGTVAFKKVEDTSSCLEWYKNLLITNGIEYDEDGLQHMIMNGMDVTEDIRTQEISQKASLISAHACVREMLLDMQRPMRMMWLWMAGTSVRWFCPRQL